MTKIIQFSITQEEFLSVVETQGFFRTDQAILEYCRDEKGLVVEGKYNLKMVGTVTSWQSPCGQITYVKQILD